MKFLTREQEAALIRDAQAGDIVARNMLIKRNLGYIYTYCQRFGRPGTDIREFVAEASMGYIKAIEKFDFKKRVRLNTYAKHWMHATVTRFSKKIESTKMGSLDAPVPLNGEGQEYAWIDVLEDLAHIPQDEAAHTASRVRLLHKAAATLSGIPKLIWQKRLGTDKPLTFAEIGDMVGLSRERIRQLEHKTQRRLRQLILAYEKTPALMGPSRTSETL